MAPSVKTPARGNIGPVDVYGIDFTSRPTTRKPITCLHCVLDDFTLHARQLTEWPSFADFEHALRRPGPWIAGLDFPFGQARRFVEDIGWPMDWERYVRRVEGMSRNAFRELLDDYRRDRAAGDKEHRRTTDIAAGAISPQKLYGTPVGLMFFEGSPRLRQASVTIPGIRQGDPERVVVEAYPGVLARQLIGRRPYKQDTAAKQTADQYQARRQLLQALRPGGGNLLNGLTVVADDRLADDPTGDHLDALLCAIQAAWAWCNRSNGFGAPADVDPIEGWIAMPLD
jgi:hypothetical protein